MASGAAPCSDQRSSAADSDRPPPAAAAGCIRIGRKWIGGHGHCEICVVCGDRACNHHYYGVAACHGCKCFFWRSIKNKMRYICRGDGHCEINPNHRNACRFCRLQRCLKAGMQPEAVRMPKEGAVNAGNGGVSAELAKMEQTLKQMAGEEKTATKAEGDSSHCPLCHQHTPQKAGNNTEAALEALDTRHLNAVITFKCKEELGQALVRQLIEIESSISEVADFSENEAPKRQLSLDSLFRYPEFLDRFRTQVNYCVRLRRVTEEEMDFCKYRTLAKVVDYIRSLSTMRIPGLDAEALNASGGEWLSVQDKIVLLRHSFAPLALFDIATGTSFTTKDTQNLLCLPTGLTVCANEEIVPNGFLSQQIVCRCISSLVRVLTELSLDEEEFVMVKLIIALAMDPSMGDGESDGFGSGEESLLYTQPAQQQQQGSPLSAQGKQFVERLRDSVHAALYKHSPKRAAASSSSASSEAAVRFAKLLHILPKLTLLSRDLVEHIRMVHTFPTARSRPADPLFFQMFGDIFNEGPQNRVPALSTHPGSPFSAASSPSLGRGGGAQQQLTSVMGSTAATNGRCSPKLISSPYKAEYHSPPQQQRPHLLNELLPFPYRDSAFAGAVPTPPPLAAEGAHYNWPLPSSDAANEK